MRRQRTTAIRTILIAATCVLSAALAGPASAAPPEPLAVEVSNASEPVLCAEKDNVTINLASRDVRRLRIEAAHPAYIGSLQRDSFEADWTGCSAAGDPAPSAGPAQPPRRTTLYEDIELWVVGLTFPTFWRPATATVRIGERVATGVHLLQVWMIRPMGGEEVLVLYPQDGYWRLRPLAPAGMAPTAFGSSFLLGPVEVEGRPIVRIKEVAFDPKARTFSLQFERGGSATVKMAKTDQNRNTLEIAFDSGDRRPPVRRAALHVRHRLQQRRGPHRRARERRQGLARGAHHGLQARHRHRRVDGPRLPLAPQHVVARHGVQRVHGRSRAGVGGTGEEVVGAVFANPS